MNNLDIFRKNIELVSEIVFSNIEMNNLKEKLVDYLLSENYFDKQKINIDDFNEKFKSTINLISLNAPIKIIHDNKNESEIMLMFNEIVSEIKKIELRNKIQSLEDKVALNLDETLYTELLTLRNQLKSG